MHNQCQSVNAQHILSIQHSVQHILSTQHIASAQPTANIQHIISAQYALPIQCTASVQQIASIQSGDYDFTSDYLRVQQRSFINYISSSVGLQLP